MPPMALWLSATLPSTTAMSSICIPWAFSKAWRSATWRTDGSAPRTSLSRYTIPRCSRDTRAERFAVEGDDVVYLLRDGVARRGEPGLGAETLTAASPGGRLGRLTHFVPSPGAVVRTGRKPWCCKKHPSERRLLRPRRRGAPRQFVQKHVRGHRGPIQPNFDRSEPF